MRSLAPVLGFLVFVLLVIAAGAYVKSEAKVIDGKQGPVLSLETKLKAAGLK
jgi:hypothetical protein